ncbi:MAG: hypothetical protein NXI02_21095, partial [Rhodobacteraceae bacterium]|nr:hypothetical protein [Paracoccaceae bacterium]
NRHGNDDGQPQGPASRPGLTGRVCEPIDILRARVRTISMDRRLTWKPLASRSQQEQSRITG